jgi:hypothetical protein
MAERGRPKKPKSDLRTKQFHVMLTEAEHEEIGEAAKSSDSDMAAWARRILLDAARRKR